MKFLPNYKRQRRATHRTKSRKLCFAVTSDSPTALTRVEFYSAVSLGRVFRVYCEHISTEDAAAIDPITSASQWKLMKSASHQ